jgi:hypothetical protein
MYPVVEHLPSKHKAVGLILASRRGREVEQKKREGGAMPFTMSLNPAFPFKTIK